MDRSIAAITALAIMSLAAGTDIRDVERWLFPAPIVAPVENPEPEAPPPIPAAPVVAPLPAAPAPPPVAAPAPPPPVNAPPVPPAAEPRPKAVPKPAPPKHVPPKPKPKPQPKPAAINCPCGQIALGIQFYGVEGVRRKAREMGYSNAQISACQRACGY